ncbi:MAG TPA: hypothetical protein VL738_12755 [Dactylosporangium sp.]|nr:hypothetical protein [Dactylosporangium sp.]
MPDDIDRLIRRLIGGDERAAAEIHERSRTEAAPVLLVAAALLAAEPGDLLDRAVGAATTTRDRQLVAIARAHLDGDEERLDAFVRDHLAEHPDNILAAWIAAQHTTFREKP